MPVNKYCGYYDHGNPFTPSKWLHIITVYFSEIEKTGKCTVRRLSSLAQISTKSSRKAIQHVSEGIGIPTPLKRGHGKSGAGGMKGFGEEHSAYLYSLYKKNPSLLTIYPCNKHFKPNTCTKHTAAYYICRYKIVHVPCYVLICMYYRLL